MFECSSSVRAWDRLSSLPSFSALGVLACNLAFAPPRGRTDVRNPRESPRKAAYRSDRYNGRGTV